jgi:cytochrome b pre-mRNA-processing protein 3
MGLGKLFRHVVHGDPQAVPARDLYERVVAQARRPAFYADFGVPDTLDGRFEMIGLHLFLVLYRLKGEPTAAELSRAVVETMVLDMDRSLREMGAGDLGVGRRVKAMARGLYGRIAAYEAGLDGPDAMLEAALGRNLYGTVAPAPAHLAAVAGYMRAQAAALAGQDLAMLLAGEVAFGPPPVLSGGAGEDR